MPISLKPLGAGEKLYLQVCPSVLFVAVMAQERLLLLVFRTCRTSPAESKAERRKDVFKGAGLLQEERRTTAPRTVGWRNRLARLWKPWRCFDDRSGEGLRP